MTLSPVMIWTLTTLVATIVALYAVNRYLSQFYWRIAICLVAVVVGGLTVAAATRHYIYGEPGVTFKLGVDLVGGTILVYEVDSTKFQDGNVPPNVGVDLAAALKRRIDPADLYNVTIRPVSNTRVEIILPTGGQHEAVAEQHDWEELEKKVADKWRPKEGDTYHVAVGQRQKLIDAVKLADPDADLKEVVDFINKHYEERKEKKHLTAEQIQEVKELITQVGSLEFRILANDNDDREGIEAAQKYFKDAATNNSIKKQLEDAALGHRPPPRPANGEAFPVKLSTGTYKYSYSWIELGRLERQSLGLSNNDRESAHWKQLERAREKGEATIVSLDRDQVARSLFWSRKAENVETLPAKDRNKEFEYFVLTRDPEPGREVTGKYLTRVEQGEADGGLAVNFQFNNQGGNLFGELTTRNRPEGNFRRFLAIVLDGKIESAPALNAVITHNGQITGSFTKEQVDRYVRVLRSGQLPATLIQTPVSENTMGPTLGAVTIRKGTVSVAIAFGIVLLFMLIYYRFAGLVACMALLANLLLTIAFMVGVQATFTLPGLAGLVLMLGMAVDANVLIYERLREERERGASLPLAIRNGYDRAFPTIIDTHLSSIFTAIVLYAVGNDQLKGFGISLTVGLIISLFTSLYMTRLMFDLWQAKNWLHKLSMMRLFSRPNIDFMRIRYYWFTATIVLTIFGAGVFVARLPNDLNIDFTGGTAYGGQLSHPMTLTDLRDQLTKDQDQRLKLKEGESGVKQQDAEGYEWEITYEGEDQKRHISLPQRATEPDVRRRASHLDDFSVEQYFKGYIGGNASDQFTVRTSEKAPELVQAIISRLLGDNLKRIAMEFKVDPKDPGQKATLTFLPDRSQQSEEGAQPYAYASPSQVRMLLERKFKAEKVSTPFHLIQPPGMNNEEDRYRELQVAMGNPIDPATFQRALAATQQEFKERPQPDRLENFDSQLAKQTQLSALYAILASWGALLLYLWFRFGSWTFGLAAVACLIHDLFFTLGIIAFAHYLHLWSPGFASTFLIEDFKIDLPAVAALLTLVGYSVSDTIVVFDRIREVRGKNPELTPQTINDSVNQTLSRTLLTSFSVWLVVIVLYLFGGEGVHLFSFCMVIGVIVGTYSSIYIASPLLLIFGEGAPTRKEERRPPAQPVEAAV